MAMIISFTMPPVGLMVVILDKTLVDVLCLFPTCGLLEMIITHSSHHGEVTFNQIFPALFFVNPFLLNLKRFVDGHGLFCTEDTTIVRHQSMRAAVPLNGRVQDEQH